VRLLTHVLFASCLVFSASQEANAGQQQQKDYLSSVEADKVRDAENNTNERIRLFLMFAEDRLKKFQYELEHPPQTVMRTC